MREPLLIEEIVDKILIDVLIPDAELQASPLNGRIYPDMEPGEEYPVLIIQGVTGEATRTLNATHVWRDATVQITARDRGGTDKSALILIMRRVDILLNGIRIQDDGMYIGPISQSRERPRGTDNIDGVLYPQIVVEYDLKAYRV